MRDAFVSNLAQNNLEKMTAYDCRRSFLLKKHLATLFSFGIQKFKISKRKEQKEILGSENLPRTSTERRDSFTFKRNTTI